MPAHPRYFSAAATDKGSVRPENEDRIYSDDARGFFLVVDGVGGYGGGEQAAEIAVERIRTRLERQTDAVEQRLREAITLANNAIFEKAQQTPECRGMACVLTVAVVGNGQVTVGHVGDSRLYKIQRGSIAKITRDHSPVGEREDSGELTEADAMRHPRRNEVYRDVGSEEHRPDDEEFIEIFTFDFEPDAAFLLCSDGLTDAISSRMILDIIEQNAGDHWAAVRTLIAAATEIGKDNVSVILVEGERFAASFRVPSFDSGQCTHLPQADAGEETGRLPAISSPAASASKAWWHPSAPAYLLCGVLIGVALAFAAQWFGKQGSFGERASVLVVNPPGTIWEALAKAQPGDMIDVAPGTYMETVTLKEGVALVARPAKKAIIQGSVTADNLREARLEGFEIRGREVGVRINDSDVVLSRDDIAESHGAGVEFGGDSRGAMFACNIHNNGGAGIVVSDAASPVIENNLIFENGLRVGSLRPGILVRSSLSPLVAHNIIAANGAEAIWLPAADETLAQQNSFTFAGKMDHRPNFHIVPLQDGRRERR